MTFEIEHQVREIAESRCPRRGLPVELVVTRAMHYLYIGKCQRPSQAIEWAFHDFWDSENNQPIRPLLEKES